MTFAPSSAAGAGACLFDGEGLAGGVGSSGAGLGVGALSFSVFAGSRRRQSSTSESLALSGISLSEANFFVERLGFNASAGFSASRGSASSHQVELQRKVSHKRWKMGVHWM